MSDKLAATHTVHVNKAARRCSVYYPGEMTAEQVTAAYRAEFGRKADHCLQPISQDSPWILGAVTPDERREWERKHGNAKNV